MRPVPRQAAASDPCQTLKAASEAAKNGRSFSIFVNVR